MKRIAIYPGTFDPVTNGHLDLVARGVPMFDEVILAITTNVHKKPLFDIDERVSLAEAAVAEFGNVVVDTFSGLLVQYVLSKDGMAVIRGLRAVSDFEYEFQMALMNRRLSNKVETIFMMPSEEYSFTTSTMIKEVASFGGPVSGLVPPGVEEALRKKFSI